MTILASQKKSLMSKMLPPSLIPILFMVYGITFSQQRKELVLVTNDSHNVNLFFPEVISKFILGAPNFKFTHEPNTQIGSLQGRKGVDSNLTVITNDGNIYSFLLRYGSKINSFNFFIEKSDAIGNIKGASKQVKVADTRLPKEVSVTPTPPPVAITPMQPNPDPVYTPTQMDTQTKNPSDPSAVDPNDYYLPPPSEEYTEDEDDLYNSEREEYYRIFCENNFMQPSYIKRTFTTSKNIVLRINNILGDRNELYFVMQIENNAKTTYKTDYLNFFTQKKSPKEQLLMEPLYKYNLQNEIAPQRINEVVYVFKKFKINPKEKVVIVLDEKEGKRTLVLSIFDKQVNTIKI